MKYCIGQSTAYVMSSFSRQFIEAVDKLQQASDQELNDATITLYGTLVVEKMSEAYDKGILSGDYLEFFDGCIDLDWVDIGRNLPSWTFTSDTVGESIELISDSHVLIGLSLWLKEMLSRFPHLQENDMVDMYIEGVGEVIKANTNKIDQTTGKCYTNSFGKYVKPLGWVPPNHHPIFEKYEVPTERG